MLNLVKFGWLFSWLTIACQARSFSPDRSDNQNVPSLLPMAGLLSNSHGAKSPLVAATYYFNPSPSLSGRPEPFPGNEPSSNRIKEADSDDDNDVCRAPDGRQGTCYEASECVSRGGTPMGRCDDSSSPGSVCCLFEVTCGQSASERFTYFRNPGFPSAYTQTQMCRTRIGKIDKNVCQFRIDLRTFDLARPVDGNCSQDIFVVSGQNQNDIVPKICGLNTGQHYYIGVDESGVISFHVMMLGAYHRRFDVLISQVRCHKDVAAPPHCLQYYTGTHGTIKSFNYDYQEESSTGLNEGYPNDIDYMICIKKESGFCSVTYELSSDGDGVLPFAVGSSGAETRGQTSWPVSAECVDDYLVIGGMRLCSGSKQVDGDGVSSQLTDNGLRLTQRQGNLGNATNTRRTVLTDSTPGPFMVRFVANNNRNARGFHINYRQNPCK